MTSSYVAVGPICASSSVRAETSGFETVPHIGPYSGRLTLEQLPSILRTLWLLLVSPGRRRLPLSRVRVLFLMLPLLRRLVLLLLMPSLLCLVFLGST